MTHRLFPIPLYGHGTSEVESFSSYLYRISYEHGIYVGELIRYAYRSAIEEIGGPDGYPEMPKYLRTNELIRPGKTTRMMIELFRVLTRQDMYQSFMWFLDGSIGHARGDIVEGFQWCPECFREMENMGEKPYFKLLWHLKDIKSCHIHRTPLVDRCQSCGCDQVTYKRQYPIGYCQNCGEKLSKRKKRLKAKDISNSWEMMGADLVQMFGDIAENKNELIDLEGMRHSLDKIYDHYWFNEREKELYEIVDQRVLTGIIDGNEKVSLKTVRRIAYVMGLSLYDLLSGNADKTSAILNLENICELQPSFMLTHKKEKHDHKAILRRVKKIISNSNQPPSLHGLVKQAGISEGYLRHRYPVLIDKVVNRYKEYEAYIQLHKIYQAQAAALKYFNEEAYGCHIKSRKQAYKFLRQETGLPKHKLKKAIQNAYMAINN